ncbi:MAG: helix-turn-helix transcriptional regulator, partial [Oscillospiraceae bacterium]|nr:helix-turn-helix transcriptional regulator [Oscillospiraceae bacterium]
YENGERVPPLDVMITFAKYYKVSLDYLSGLTNKKYKYW